MRKFSRIAVLVGIAMMFVSSVGTQVHAAPRVGLKAHMFVSEAERRAKECRYRTVDGVDGWTTWEVKRTIKCAVARWGLDLDMAMLIADHESSFNEFAQNPSSGACGIYQHLPSYWPSRVAAVPSRLDRTNRGCYNARSNILAALHMAAGSGGWYPWCGFTTYC